MSSFDRKLATAVKLALKKPQDGDANQRASKEFREVQKQIRNQDLADAVERLFSDISRPVTELKAAQLSASIKSFIDRGFTESSSAIFLARIDCFSPLSLWEVLPIVPTVPCFDRWIKTSKADLREVERELLQEPSKTYATVGADWLLGRLQSESVLPLLGTFLFRRPRPDYLPSWDKSLAVALRKDRRGDLLALAFRGPSLNEDQFSAWAEVIRSDWSLLRTVTDLLPSILASKLVGPSIVRFSILLFGALIAEDGDERERATATLARLGTGIVLADKQTAESDKVLAYIRETTRRLRNLTKGEAAQSRTWVFENLLSEEKRAEGNLCINFQGARYIALAFDKANQGFPLKEILTVTARNLGLSPLAAKGENVIYDPLFHEDIDGGLVPGDKVNVLEPGWRLNQEVVVRARVRR